MPNIIYKYKEEIKELKHLLDYPVGIPIQIDTTELLPDGSLEITYGLTPLCKMQLEIWKKLKEHYDSLS